MTRACILGGLAALFVATSPCLAANRTLQVTTSSSQDSRTRADDHDRRGGRHGRAGCGNRKQEASPGYSRRNAAQKPNVFGECRNRRQEPSPGYSRRNAAQKPSVYGERSHSSSCACSPCGRKRGRHSGDTTVVVVENDGRGGDTVIVLQDGERRRDRGYGRSPSVAYGAAFGFSWADVSRDRGGSASGSTLRTHADKDCREPGTVLASSGNLYLKVRADGRLSIRSR